MAYNGSGVFNRLYNWVTDAANAIDIEAVRMDAEDDGFATGLSNTITRDGQSTITANIPFNSKRITGLADPVADQDAATRAYVLSQSALGPDLAAIEALTSAANKVLTSTGTDTWALVDATAGARAAWALTYAADKMVYWSAAGTAATTTVTVLARQLLDDGNTTSMRTTLGLGTVATLNTGVASGDIPLLSATGLPAVGGAALTSLPAPGYNSGNQTITTSASVYLNHGLGSRPSLVTYTLVCITAEHGFAVGNEIPANMNSSLAGSSRVNTAVENETTNTQIAVRFSDTASCFVSAVYSSGNATALTNANWNIIVKAWK